MMRPLLSIVLLCAACGDNLLVDSEEGPGVDDATEVEALSFVPDVCSVRSWPTVEVTSRDVDLSVAPTATGVAVFTVDRGGGPLRGFVINGRGELETAEQGTTIRKDHTFLAASAAYIDERIITAAVTDKGTVAIDMVRPDLEMYVNLDTVPGTTVADLPIAHAREHRLATVAGDTGLTAVRFDKAWKTTGAQLVGATETAPLAVAATRYREDTMVAWSTESTCHLSRIAAEVSSARDFPCVDGRFAVDANAQTGYLVFDDGANNVEIAPIVIGLGRELRDPQRLAEYARAPKIAFDGTRYWVAYTNARQDVVVGYLGSNGALVSMALEGTQPMPEAYELVVVNGVAWLFTADGAGVGAQRLCLKAVR
jgi:hypothetical protein